MNMINTVEKAKKFKMSRILEEQKDWARDGISIAVVNGEIVTVGDSDCDYANFKAFCVDQMIRMGMKQFANKTEWPLYDMARCLTEEGPESDVWFDTAYEYFDAIEGDY